jgi:hypothetical protein
VGCVPALLGALPLAPPSDITALLSLLSTLPLMLLMALAIK